MKEPGWFLVWILVMGTPVFLSFAAYFSAVAAQEWMKIRQQRFGDHLEKALHGT